MFRALLPISSTPFFPLIPKNRKRKEFDYFPHWN